MTDDIVQRLRAGNHRLCVGARLDPLRVDRPCDPCSESLDAADEIERLRAEVEAWRTAAQGAGAQAVRLRELIHALNIRMVQPFMSGGGQFSAHGTLTADQWAIVAAAFEEADRDA